MLETIRQFGPERLEAADCYLETRAFVDF